MRTGSGCNEPGDEPAQLGPTQRAEVLAIVARHRQRPGPLLEILHDVQDPLGFVPPDAVPLIAAELNLSRADVHGVISFYHHFRDTPPGRRIRLCRAEACQSMNGRALEAHVKQRLGMDSARRRPTGASRSSRCTAWALRLLAGRDDRRRGCYGRVTPERFERARPTWERGEHDSTVCVPRDARRGRVGAEATARKLVATAGRAGRQSDLCRNGSRGMCWLEPLVEVRVRRGSRRLRPGDGRDVQGLFDAGLLQGARAPAAARAPSSSIPWLATQQRLTFARVGVIDPLDLDDYLGHGGYRGLRARAGNRAGCDRQGGDRLRASWPRRRGVSDRHQVEDRPRRSRPQRKFIACNADEGDSGTFSDRMLMEGDPFA